MDAGCWEGIGFDLMILLRLASCRYADCRRTSINIIISKSTNTIFRGFLIYLVRGIRMCVCWLRIIFGKFLDFMYGGRSSRTQTLEDYPLDTVCIPKVSRTALEPPPNPEIIM